VSVRQIDERLVVVDRLDDPVGGRVLRGLRGVVLDPRVLAREVERLARGELDLVRLDGHVGDPCSGGAGHVNGVRTDHVA